MTRSRACPAELAVVAPELKGQELWWMVLRKRYEGQKKVWYVPSSERLGESSSLV